MVVSHMPSVSEWWLAGGKVPWKAVAVGGANVIDRRSVDVIDKLLD